jgi:Ca-activated chloride channel family protein
MIEVYTIRASAKALVAVAAAALFVLPLAASATSAQSGRQPQQSERAPTPRTQGQRPPAPPNEKESRPRRVNEEPQDEDSIKLSSNLVTVVTSVTDAAGNQVNDLTEKDFVIYEDNEPQEAAGFYREGQMPLRMIFLFDSSSSIRHRFDFEQRAAAQFFRQIMRPGDQGAIISVSTDPKLEVQFTGDVEKIVGGLAGLKPEGATALYNSMIEAARYIRPSEGRHIMVVLSDGTDTSSSANLSQALKEVQISDAVIYAVHSTGVAPSANVQDLAGEFVLKAVAEDTGGRAFFPPIYDDPKKEARDLDEIYRRIAAEVRAQYVLTYYSGSNPRPGTFKTIRVEVKRPGLQVRTRRGYYTAK